MDTVSLGEEFQRIGFHLQVKRFADLDLKEVPAATPVLYTSSEDSGLHYKSYIEDIVLALKEQGANPLPAFKFLRAHHNKSMMELLRYQIFPEQARRLDTKVFGTYEELQDANLSDTWPKVIKTACGAGSTGVAKANDRDNLLKIARRYSYTGALREAAREYRSRLLWPGYYPRSLHREKFIVQEMVPNLSGDFKVLRYGRRYFPLFRKNRPGDFRASGSGMLGFELPKWVNENALLDFAREVSHAIGFPMASLDIGFDGTEFHLLEFQVLNFGTFAAEKSLAHYVRESGRWEKLEQSCQLERFFAEAIAEYLSGN